MIEFRPVKDFCLEELRLEDDRSILLDIYQILLKAKGTSYVQARSDFLKANDRQLKFIFPEYDK